MVGDILNYMSGYIFAKLDGGEKVLVQQVQLQISANETLALIGETGSGKTMLAQSIMGILPTNVYQIESKFEFCGKQIGGRKDRNSLLGKEITYIPQNGQESLNPSRRIKYQIYDSLQIGGIPRKLWRDLALEKLKTVGFTNMEEIMEKYPFQLSGGMNQRITIALALCTNARLVIADEPTNGLDRTATSSFMSMLNECFPNTAKLIITHDISVARLCDRILVLCGGRIMEAGLVHEVLGAPKHPYTKALLNSLVMNKMQETPILRKECGVCPFTRRCTNARPICLEKMKYHNLESHEWWCNQ